MSCWLELTCKFNKEVLINIGIDLTLAITMGLLGSIHCVGMCGGIVAALSMSQKNGGMSGIFTYHFGRLFTYSILGATMGTIGSMTVYNAGLSNVQNYISIITGGLIIIFALQTGGWISAKYSYLSKISIPSKLLKGAAKQGSITSWGLVGLVNGILPCGIVYAALALSIKQADLFNGGILMFAFGLGTIPAMTIFCIIIRRMSPAIKGRFLKVSSIVIILFGFFTIYRGISKPHKHGLEMQIRQLPYSSSLSTVN